MTLPKTKRRVRPKLVRALQYKARNERKLQAWLEHVEERNKKQENKGVTKVK